MVNKISKFNGRVEKIIEIEYQMNMATLIVEYVDIFAGLQQYL